MTERLATGELLGSVLDDRYTVQELVGRGGMAVVYRAWDAELHRSVAIKVLRDGTEAGPEAQRRVREARALASINHPALVTLFDAVIRDDRSYLVMELVDGITLRGQIATGRLESRDVAAIAHDLADGLHAVHANGVIHRDIKPANILLAPTTLPHQHFRAKLSDFGIAHFVDASRVTMPGLFLGTASYVSPEQARGVEPAAPADIYALGLTLLEALTGESAFTGSALEVMSARLHRDPHIPAWLGLEWSVLLTRMTDRDPALRPTAIDVAAAARAIPPVDRRPSDSAISTGALEVILGHPTATPDPASATADELTEPNPTLLLPLSAAPSDAQPQERAVEPTQEATQEAPEQPNEQLVEAAPKNELSQNEKPHGGLRHRLRTVGVVSIFLLVVALVGLIAINRPGASPETQSSTPAVVLPSLAPPLDADLRDLLDQVTP